MLQRINIIRIIADHLNTYKSVKDERYRILELLIHFLLPAVIAYLVLYEVGISLNDETIINMLVTSFSIFAALLLNLLLLVFDIVNKLDVHDKGEPISVVDSEQRKQKAGSISQEIKKGIEARKGDLKARLIRELFANISFSILVSIVSVILLVTKILVIKNSMSLHCIFDLIIFYLTIVFIFTLLIILRRIHVLLSDEFRMENNRE